MGFIDSDSTPSVPSLDGRLQLKPPVIEAELSYGKSGVDNPAEQKSRKYSGNTLPDPTPWVPSLG